MMNEKSASSKTDWNLCVVCQGSKAETLQCPVETKRSDVGAGYKTLAENIQQFNQLGCMPVQINLSRLDEGDGIESTFLRYKARWHKGCYLLFNSTKLNRAKKRHAPTPDESVNSKYTQSTASTSSQVDASEKSSAGCLEKSAAQCLHF